MRHTRTHPRILGYLGRALSLEYSAVQQYMTQANLAEAWGLTEAAERFRRETVEEMQHADRITKRMLGLGFAPNRSQLMPVGIGHTLVDLLLQDVTLENRIVGLYDEAQQFCQRVHDHDSASFFGALLREEQYHAQEIDAWLVELGAKPAPEADQRVFF